MDHGGKLTAASEVKWEWLFFSFVVGRYEGIVV